MKTVWRNLIRNNVFIVLILILIAPFGLILMWRYTPWTKRTKTLITSMVVILFVLLSLVGYNAPPTIQLNGINSTQSIETTDDNYTLEGYVSTLHSPSLKVNDAPVAIDSAGKFTYAIKLKEGTTKVTFIAKSKKGETREIISLHRTLAQADTNQSSSHSDQALYQVVSVTDGDTIKVSIDGKTQTIRFIGIDTPETKDPDKPVQCYGKEATSRMQHYVQSKKVRLESDQSQGNTDKYGRLLRYVFLEDNTHVGFQMIKEGYAREYTYSKPYTYQSQFKMAQLDAKAAGYGLWSGDSCAGTTETVKPPESPSTSAAQPAAQPSQQTITSTPATTPQEPNQSSVYYPNCKAARAAGVTPIYSGQPGYSSHLDGDNDGIACE